MSFEPEIIKGRPPNFEAIAAVFPLARRMSVAFAYGDVIYVPTGDDLPPKLYAHETVHCVRQKEIGVEEWWRRYLEDPTFRYYEELLGHRAEYKWLELHARNRQERRGALEHTAKRLTAKLYEYGVPLARAKRDLVDDGGTEVMPVHG